MSSCLQGLFDYAGEDMMSSETFSFILWCWHDRQTDSIQLRIVRTDTAEEVHINGGAFLLRFFTDQHTQVERCLIRHLASRREAYIQGGPNLRAFVKACLLDSGESKPPATEPPGE